MSAQTQSAPRPLTESIVSPTKSNVAELQEKAADAKRSISETVSSSLSYASKAAHAVANSTSEQVAEAAEPAMSKVKQVAPAVNGVASKVHEKAQEAAPEVAAKAKTMAENAKDSAASAVGYTVGAARATKDAGVNIATAAAAYSAGGAVMAAKLYIQTANAVFQKTANAASSVTNYATSTACGIADNTTHLVTRSVTATSSSAKRILPEAITSRAESGYQTIEYSAYHPLQTAEKILPGRLYSGLNWSVETASSVGSNAIGNVMATRDYIYNRTSNAYNSTVDSLEKAEASAFGTGEKALADLRSFSIHPVRSH